jgi:hypothetical protein
MEIAVMSVPNIQHSQEPNSDTRNHLVGYPDFPFGFTNWTAYTRCNKKTIAEKSIQFDHVPEATQHLEADRLDTRTAQRAPVEEPPNQPQKPPIKEPPPKEPDREPPQKPPLPSDPPVEEPPNEPRKPPVKEPPPKDPDREPSQKPPARAVLAGVKDE